MNTKLLHILFVDDDEDDYLLTRDLLEEIPGTAFHLDWAHDYEQAFARLTGHRYDACLVDYHLGAHDGIELIAEAHERGIRLPFILLTGQGDREIDVAAMNAGAADFLDKSQLSADLLERSLRYSIHSHRIESQRSHLLEVAERQAAQLRYLARELTQAEQRERRRVAQTLHDHLQQLLVAAKMRTDRLAHRAQDPQLKQAAMQVDDLLNQSIEASRSLTVQLSPPVLHDRGLVPGLEWLSRMFAKEHDLKVEVQEVNPVDVPDDNIRDFLFQAVRELLFNVVKHAQVNEAQVLVRGAGRKRVQVTVIDHGAGCEASRLLRERSDEGFGLFHLQRRIEFLGGSFYVEAAPGKGCRISLTVSTHGIETPTEPAELPLRPQVEGPGPGAAPCVGAPEIVRVLFVDDHKILREGLAGLLRDQPGIDVVGEAADGRTAVELCRRLRPHVVVMDVSMPGMSGIDATQAIRSQMPSVQVVGLSMHEKDDMAQAMREAGAAAYLPKGGPSEDLVTTIRSLAAGVVPPEPEVPAAAKDAVHGAGR